MVDFPPSRPFHRLAIRRIESGRRATERVGKAARCKRLALRTHSRVIIRIYISQPTGRDPDSLATARVSRAPTVQGRLGYLRVRVSRIRSGSYAVRVVARILRLPLGAARRYYIHRAVRFAPVKRLVGAPSCLWINVEKRKPGSSGKLLWRCFSLRWCGRTVVRGLYCRVL